MPLILQELYMEQAASAPSERQRKCQEVMRGALGDVNAKGTIPEPWFLFFTLSVKSSANLFKERKGGLFIWKKEQL